MTVRLGDIPSWLAWVTTFSLLVVAFYQIARERHLRHEAEREAAGERHVEQARLVSAILGHEEVVGEEGPEEWLAEQTEGRTTRTAVNLVNGSDEPVYTLVVGIVFVQGAGPRTIEEWLRLQHERTGDMMVPVTTASILPRGTSRVWIAGVGWSAILGGRSGADVGFTDRAGYHWIRRALGKLEELPVDPFTFFQAWGLYGPYDLQTPEPVS